MDEQLDMFTPDLTGIPIDDKAEPSDAEVKHLATPDEVAEVAQR